VALGSFFKIKQTLENAINQVYNQVENVYLIDHTYYQEKNSRRLHSLGGLRRILSLSQEVKKSRSRSEKVKVKK